MSSNQAADPIETAVNLGFVSGSQAAMLREELYMFPGSNVVSIMLRRGMISSEQAKQLEGGPSLTPPPEDADMDFGFTAPPAPAKPVAPPPQAPPRPANYNTPPARPPAPQPPAFQSLRNTAAPTTKSSPALRAATHTMPSGLQQTAGIAPDNRMLRLFKAGKERGCSDLHLSVGKPPYLRQHGKIYFLDEAPLTKEVSRDLNRSILTAAQQAELDENQQVDVSFECANIGRFRANIYQQRLGIEGSYRFIPGEVPSIDSLGLPKTLEKLTTYPQGLNLVTGPSGSGKTSTVAAMLDYINRHRHEHIITVEDPVEYVIHPISCQVTQREVGTHTESFAHALRTALRQDPDIIMIGELRDLETTSISITAAETGHLVFGTLHTSGAARTVARILDVFPPSQRAQICLMVAESLRGITSQQLIERKDGKGRVCAMEILLGTTGVSQVIKEGKSHQLISHMQSGRKLGMISMDDALMELVQEGLIAGKEAYARADNKGQFEMLRNLP